MKKILALILAMLMLVSCLAACDNTPVDPSDSESDTSNPSESIDSSSESLEIPLVDPSAASLFVGYARECITPPDEMLPRLKLTGYADGREITAVETDLYVSCTAFKDAEGDIALIYTLDLHAMSPAQATGLTSQITKETKVPKANIILNVTHNHAAPGTGGEFLDDVITPAVVKAAKDAIADLKACTALFAGEVDMKYYSFVRRYIEENGKPTAHISEGDPMVPVARFVRDGGKDVLLVNFAAHADTVSGRAWTTLSADYIYYFRRVVEHELDCHFSMQLGATGDLNPSTRIDEPSFYSKTDSYGKNLGYKIVNEIKELPQLEIKGNIEAKSSNARVEVDHSSDNKLDLANEVWDLYYSENEEDNKKAEAKMKEYGIASIYEAMYIRSRAGRGQFERRNVSAVSIGNIVFAAADYEMLSATGRHIKDAGNEDFDLTFMCAYSNGMIGYIPDDHTFNYYVYEVYSCPYVRGSAEIIEAKIIELMGELAE